MDNTILYNNDAANNVSLSSDNTPMSDEELKKTLNIPERNTEDYPEISKERQLKAGTFLYKLNLLASSADGNLQSLVWDFYDKLDDYIHLGINGSSLELAKSIEYLKDYLNEHDNILFHDVNVNAQS